MIHTDGKPTIANTRLVPSVPIAYRCPECGQSWTILDNPEEYAYGHDCETDCPCAECSENDPDSMPGGYDNPAEPIDWEDMS